MSYEKIYQDWEDSAQHAHIIAVNIASETGRIHETISKRPGNIIHQPTRNYMERALERLLGILIEVDNSYVYPIQDLIWTDDKEAE